MNEKTKTLKKYEYLGYCPTCGQDVEVDFCEHCGKPVQDADGRVIR